MEKRWASKCSQKHAKYLLGEGSSLWELRSLGWAVKTGGHHVLWAPSPATLLAQAMVASPLDHRNVPISCLLPCSPPLQAAANGVFLTLKCDCIISYMAFFSGPQVPSGFYSKSSAGLQCPSSFSFQHCLCLPPLSSSTPRMFPHMLPSNAEELLLILSAGHSLSSL